MKKGVGTGWAGVSDPPPFKNMWVQSMFCSPSIKCVIINCIYIYIFNIVYCFVNTYRGLTISPHP